MEGPRKGDWLAVLDDEGRVVGIVEVVAVCGAEIDAFELFPVDGRPVKARAERCLEFVKPTTKP
ncbi:MAG: hypothetical protein ACPLRW_13615 [Moorellales bacterium]